MTLTVRLDPALERELDAVCRRQRLTKSQVVTGLLRQFVAREPRLSSYEIAARLGVIGSDSTGPRDAGARAKQLVRQALRGKKRHR